MQRRDSHRNGDLSRKASSVVCGVSLDGWTALPSEDGVSSSDGIQKCEVSSEAHSSVACSYLCRVAEVGVGNETVCGGGRTRIMSRVKERRKEKGEVSKKMRFWADEHFFFLVAEGS